MAIGGEPGLLYGSNQLGWSPPSSDTGLPVDRHLQEAPRASKTPGKPGAGGATRGFGGQCQIRAADGKVGIRFPLFEVLTKTEQHRLTPQMALEAWLFAESSI